MEASPQIWTTPSHAGTGTRRIWPTPRPSQMAWTQPQKRGTDEREPGSYSMSEHVWDYIMTLWQLESHTFIGFTCFILSNSSPDMLPGLVVFSWLVKWKKPPRSVKTSLKPLAVCSTMCSLHSLEMTQRRRSWCWREFYSRQSSLICKLNTPTSFCCATLNS